MFLIILLFWKFLLPFLFPTKNAYEILRKRFGHLFFVDDKTNR